MYTQSIVFSYFQKKALRLIYFKECNAHTIPLHFKSKIVKLPDKRLFTWYEEGSEVTHPPPPFISGPPVIQGSGVPLFSLSISVCRRFEPPFYRHPLYGHPSFLYYLQTSCLWQDFSDNIAPMKYRITTKINSCGKVISLFLEDKKQH